MPPIIPVLMSDVSKLKEPVDIIKYVLWAYTHLPKNINDTFNRSELSFRYDDASTGHNPSAMCDQVRSSLGRTLTKYFPTASIIEVTVEAVDVKEDGRYNITIDIIVVINQITHNISQDYSVDANGNLVYDLNQT